MNKRFWEWLAKLADKKLKEIYVKEHNVNLQCRHCKTWAHQSKKPADLSSFEHQLAVVFTCGQCDKRSYWICEGGFWLNAADFGFSLEKLERDFHLYQVSKELEQFSIKTLVIHFTGGKNFKPQLYRLGGNRVEGINFVASDLAIPVQPSNEEMFKIAAEVLDYWNIHGIFPANFFGGFLCDKLVKFPEIKQIHLALVADKDLDLSKSSHQLILTVKKGLK